MNYIVLLLAMFFLVLSKYTTKYKKVLIFLSAIILILFASFRGTILSGKYKGNDFESYRKWFGLVENVKLSWSNEIAFNLLMLTIKRLTGSFEIFIMITSAFLVYAIYSFAIKNSESYIITIFCFITFGIYELAFSAIRQWIAGAIFLLAYQFIKDKKFWKYFISIVIAAMFHNSAIILLIVYPFINSKIKIKNKAVICVVVACIVTILMKTNIILDIIYKYMPSYKYKYMNIGKELNSNYTVFSIGMLCMLIIALYNKAFLDNNLKNKNNTNFLLLICFFSYIATLNPMFGRLLQYFMPAVPLIIPSIISIFNTKEQKMFATAVSMAFFSLMYIM